MISWFKKHFIPHEGNSNRPHFLRKENTRNIILVILFLELFTFLIPTISHLNIKINNMAAVLPAVLTDLTNNQRTEQKLDSLKTNPILSKAAEMKAKDMADKSYFAHTSPEGKNPWYWLDLVGYKYQYAGENLAINFSDSKDVAEAWMKSPTHKANIVKDKYTEIGTGIATGIYEGKETVFVAQIYANPLPKIEEKIPTTKETEETVSVIPSGEPTILGAEIVSENSVSENLLSEDKTPESNPKFWEKIIASPRSSTNIILYIVFFAIIISLALNIFIKIKHHHPDLIMNGLVVLLFIGTIMSINYSFTHRDMITSQGFDYSNEIKPL